MDQETKGFLWLAGGCFWGVEAYISKISGVLKTNVGYANGHTEKPTYDEVCSGTTGHVETVYVEYDRQQLELSTLLHYFFTVINPTTLNQQGYDVGTQYRTGIYYEDIADKAVIEQIICQEQLKYEIPIVTEVLPLLNYYVAEEYHQKYLQKNPKGYCHINLNQTPDQL